MKTKKITAFHIAESINLKEFCAHFQGNIVFSSNTEILYTNDQKTYLYIFNYGGIAFYNYPEEEMHLILDQVQNYSAFPLKTKIREDYILKEIPHNPIYVDFESITVPSIKEDVIKVVMLNLVYSVALDLYSQSADNTLEDIKKYTIELERKGKIHTSRKNMMKFIGKTLNNKNRIVENLYIFDFPDIVWENEELDQINRELRRLFNLRSRYKEIEYTYMIIEDNLNIFNQFKFHGESNRLEWIIIVLILIEVIHLFVSKLLH